MRQSLSLVCIYMRAWFLVKQIKTTAVYFRVIFLIFIVKCYALISFRCTAVFFFHFLCVFFVSLTCSISDEHCSHLRAMRKVLAFVKRFALILGVAAKLILLLFIGVFHLIPLWCYCFFLSFACMKQWRKKPLLNTRVSFTRLSFTLNITQSNIE